MYAFPKHACYNPYIACSKFSCPAWWIFPSGALQTGIGSEQAARAIRMTKRRPKWDVHS